MEFIETSLALIATGVFFMLLAIMKTRSLLSLLTGKTEEVRSWRILFFMMIFFLSGYATSFYFIVQEKQQLLVILTGIVFLAGAIFVFIIAGVSLHTINELIKKDKTEELNKELKENEVRIKQKSEELEEANKQLSDERKQLEDRVSERTSELRSVNIKLIDEIKEHKRAEQELSENKSRLERQNLALHKVTKCFQIRDDGITDTILKVMEIASETMETERAGFWLYDAQKTNIRSIDLYESSKKLHTSGAVLSVKNYPAYFKALELNRVIDANDALKDPRTSEYSETYLNPLGITSMLDAPIRRAGEMIGVVCFEHIGATRTWAIDEQLFAGAIADSVSILLESAERIAAEKKLRENEQLLSSVYDTVGDNIFVLALENEERYKFISINKSFEKTTGISFNNVVGKYVNEIIPQSSLGIVLENYKKAIHDKNIVRWVEVSESPTGRLVGEVSVAPVFDGNGKCTFLVGAVHDITDIKNGEIKIQKLNEELEGRVKDRTADLVRTQESLKLSEEKYRKLVEEAGDVVYSSDYNGHFTYINSVCKKLTGYNESELLGKHYMEIIDPVWKEKVIAFYKNQFDKQIPETLFSFPIITKTGEKKWIEQIVSQQKNAGLIVGYHAIVRDITQRKRDEEEIKNKSEELNRSNKEIRENEGQIQAMFNSAPDAVIAINDESHVIKWNHKAEKIFGWKEAEVIGKPLYELIIPERYREAHKKGIKHYIATGEGAVLNNEIEMDAVKKEGTEFSVLLSVAPVDIADKILFIGFVRDISEKKRAALIIRQKSDELERSNKELEQFAYVASHDLQEPLRMVNSYLQLLEKRYKDKLDKDAHDFINYAVDGSNRMRMLILSLLEYSRVNRVRPWEDVNVNEVLKEVIKDLSAQIKENDAVITIESSLPVIYGDKVLVGQLFQNLISNAIKFKGERTPEILVSGKKERDEYLFTVKDNGIGIQREYAGKLFTIFQRLNTRENYPGTGIGLAICKKIVEKHGGKIWFESDFGKGTTFYFTIKGRETEKRNKMVKEKETVSEEKPIA